MRDCKGRDLLVRYGEVFEVYTPDGTFLGCYRAPSDMCDYLLDNFLDWKLEDTPHENYKIKKIGRK